MRTTDKPVAIPKAGPIAWFVVAGSSVIAAATDATPRVWLQLKVAVDREVYDMTDTIEPRFEVVNRGKASVFFQKEFVFGNPGTLDFLVLDRNGEPVERFLFVDDGRLFYLFRDEEGPSKSSLVLLNTDDSAKGSRPFRVSSLVARPGEYALRFKYVARTDLADHRGRPVWNRDAGPLFASVRFKVVDTQASRDE